MTISSIRNAVHHSSRDSGVISYVTVHNGSVLVGKCPGDLVANEFQR